MPQHVVHRRGPRRFPRQEGLSEARWQQALGPSRACRPGRSIKLLSECLGYPPGDACTCVLRRLPCATQQDSWTRPPHTPPTPPPNPPPHTVAKSGNWEDSPPPTHPTHPSLSWQGSGVGGGVGGGWGGWGWGVPPTATTATIATISIPTTILNSTTSTAIVTGIPVGLCRCIAARAKHWMLNPQLVRGRLALGWLLTRPAMPSSWQLFYCLLSCSRWWRNSSPELGPLHPALAFWCAAGVAEPSAGLPTGSHETSRAGCRKTPLGSIHAGAGDTLLRRRNARPALDVGNQCWI